MRHECPCCHQDVGSEEALKKRVAELEAAVIQYAIESGWHRMDGEAYPVIAELINRPEEKP